MKISRKLIVALVITALTGIIATAQTKSRTASRSGVKTQTSATSKSPMALWVNFEGGEDVWSIACDSENVYVTLAYSKRMVIINKATGKLSQIEKDNEISKVVVACNKCYYFERNEGLYRYDPVTGESEGPLFMLPDRYDSGELMAVSPDGNYLMCDNNIVDLRLGTIVGDTPGGRVIAVNNIGGAYISEPPALYQPLEEESYTVSERAVAHDIYPDPITGNTIWCCDAGLGITPMVPEADAGIERVVVPGMEDEHLIPLSITRDDDGNFVFTTNKGIAFGGKTLEDPAKLSEKIPTGVKDRYGTELNLSGENFITPDRLGNIVFGNKNWSCLCIYNPKGIKGYTELRGKAVKF